MPFVLLDISRQTASNGPNSARIERFPQRRMGREAGHANVVTTLRFYLRPSTADARAAMSQLEEVWGEIAAGNVQQSVQRTKLGIVSNG